MNDQLIRELRLEVESCKDEMVAFLEALVRAESPSVVPESQCPVQSLLAKELRHDGFRVRILKGHGKSGGLLLAAPCRRKRSSPFQLLLGHTDTVWPLGTLARMPLELVNETLKGPGAYDMKGGLAQLVFALRSLQFLGVELPVTPVALFNSDEETGSEESSLLIHRLARRANRCYVFEPALGLSGKLKTARKGAGQFTIQIEGRRRMPGSIPRPARTRFSSFPT